VDSRAELATIVRDFALEFLGSMPGSMPFSWQWLEEQARDSAVQHLALTGFGMNKGELCPSMRPDYLLTLRWFFTAR
jgi:hypothetical protein